MKNAKDTITSDWISLISGMVLALAVFSLALLQIILLFSEGGDAQATSRGGLVLSLLSVFAYALAEITLYPKAARKTTFALSYFMSFALLAALFFHFVTTADFTYIFNKDEEATRSLLLSEGFCLCAANVVALLTRIAWEIVRYVKTLLRV